MPDEPQPVSREAFVGALEPEGDYELVTFDGLDLSEQDARRGRFTDCELRACVLDEVRLDRAHLVDTTMTGVRATTVHLRDSTWRAVTLAECRFGALLVSGARVDNVTIRGTKVDYLSLAGARLADVRLEGVSIGELDLGQAQARHVAFVDCRVDRLAVAGATLREVDLRGADLGRVEGIAGLARATISEEQAMALAPALARELQITIG